MNILKRLLLILTFLALPLFICGCEEKDHDDDTQVQSETKVNNNDETPQTSPTLIWPDDGATLDRQNIPILFFKWEAMEGVVEYQLVASGPSVEIDLTGAGERSTNPENDFFTYYFNEYVTGPENDGVWNWRVRGKFADESWTEWSSSSFTMVPMVP